MANVNPPGLQGLAFVIPPGAPAPQVAPQPYVFLIANDIVEDGITEEDSLRQILHWVGFLTDNQKESLVADAFGSFEDLKVLNEKDITAMSSDFSSRTVVNGKLLFGTTRTKRVKALIHWVQDFYRVSKVPSIVGLSQVLFRGELERALARNEIRKALRELTKTASDAASPGPLQKEKQWKEWEEKFVNYLRLHLGVNGVNLAYVIRENKDPDHGENFADFIAESIACAPLKGPFFDADKLTVFNMLVSFTTGHASGDWIKSTVKYSDGRKSMQALRAHYADEGNASRNLAEATRLRDTLHYKNERSMAFELFLTLIEKMRYIFEKEGEPWPDSALLRFLFEKVQHPGLQIVIESLKAQQTTGTDVTYTMAANHLSTAVSTLPEYIAKNRNIGAVGKVNSGQESGDGIFNSDGSIRTGYITNWNSLSKEDKNKVFAERKRSKGKRPGKAKDDQPKNPSHAANANRLKQLVEQNKKQKRTIQALKRSKPDESSIEDPEEDTDAGDLFGGKASKRNKK